MQLLHYRVDLADWQGRHWLLIIAYPGQVAQRAELKEGRQAVQALLIHTNPKLVQVWQRDSVLESEQGWQVEFVNVKLKQLEHCNCSTTSEHL